MGTDLYALILQLFEIVNSDVSGPLYHLFAKNTMHSVIFFAGDFRNTFPVEISNHENFLIGKIRIAFREKLSCKNVYICYPILAALKSIIGIMTIAEMFLECVSARMFKLLYMCQISVINRFFFPNKV